MDVKTGNSDPSSDHQHTSPPPEGTAREPEAMSRASAETLDAPPSASTSAHQIEFQFGTVGEGMIAHRAKGSGSLLLSGSSWEDFDSVTEYGEEACETEDGPYVSEFCLWFQRDTRVTILIRGQGSAARDLKCISSCPLSCLRVPCSSGAVFCLNFCAVSVTETASVH